MKSSTTTSAPPGLEPKILLGLVIAIFILLGIRPKADRLTWALENLPVMIAVPLLVWTARCFPFTPLSYRLMAIHAVILMIGGYYTYAAVPAFDWLKESLNLSRNHYDRVGHLAQGFVPAMVAREILLRTSPLRPGKWLGFLVVCVCLAISAGYELFEWASALAFGGASDDFLGSQGDIWDAQTDMACALIGACVALLSLSRLQDRQLEKGSF